MREQVIQVVETYIDAVRRNDASALLFIPMQCASSQRTPTAAPLRFGRASTSLPQS
jgi:hypothetical protein